MHKEIIVNSTPYEVRVAILEDKELVEHLIERAETKRMVGDICKGVVTAVLPGIQAAFVNIGTEKAAFLHVSDLMETREDVDEEPGDRRRGRGNGRAPRTLPPIQDILQKGQEVLVQVTKEPIATKGPRVTTQVSLPGRFAVIMPNVDHVGVSRKIEDRAERQRLKGLVEQLKPADCALIVRTVGEGADAKALENDVQHLVGLWRTIQEKAATAPAPSLVHKDVGLVIGLVRDLFNDEVDQLLLDDRYAYEELLDYLKTFAPDLRERVKLYSDPMPIFDRFGIENELDKTLDRKVWLKKGGYIIIEQTEALVAIDINTGRFIGKKNQEETIFKTNMLATREIARQLRLRDIGGIIVIDFIDMESEANKKRVLMDLRSWLKRDRAKTKAFQVSDLGLVEMSRQRVRPSLYHFMSEKCAYCESTGHVLSLDSVTNRIERMVRRVAHYTRQRDIRLQANPAVVVHLREEVYDRLQALMHATGVRLDLVDDPRLHREQFRLVAVSTGEDLMRRISGPALNGNGVPQTRYEEPPRREVGSAEVEDDRVDDGGRPLQSRGDRYRRPAGREGFRGRDVIRSQEADRGRGADRDRGPERSRDRDRPRPARFQPVGDPAASTDPIAASTEPGHEDQANDRPPRRRRRGSRGRGRRSGLRPFHGAGPANTPVATAPPPEPAP